MLFAIGGSLRHSCHDLTDAICCAARRCHSRTPSDGRRRQDPGGFTQIRLLALPRPFHRLFTDVLVDRYAFTDPERTQGVVKRLGQLPPGQHFAPIVSPFVGGSGRPDNFMIETPNVHLRTAIAEYKSVYGREPK